MRVAKTPRGSLTLEGDRLVLDWVYAKGGIQLQSLVPADAPDQLTRAFDRSRALGYIEEDASIHVALSLTSGEGDLSRLPLDAHRNHFPSLEMPGLPRPMSFPSLRDASPGVYPVVDSQELLSDLIDVGCRIIQLRVKSLERDAQDRTVKEACRLAQQAPDCQLFINDYWEQAIEHGAYGVHIGQEDLLTADLDRLRAGEVRLGLSTHSYWEFARALWVAPSYIACGPIFPTRAKAMNWIPQGLANLRYWAAVSPLPVVAIAGIHAGNLADVASTGASAAAVIQAIVSTPKPTAAYQALQDQWLSIQAQPGNPRLHQRDGSSPQRHPTTMARPTLSEA
ncbi:MAG: thiamine phosphate synthase [Betaproteobacteria bacterium]|nr:thiamine phosphate synthase [Betaproteobacteria bacterium]